MERCGKRRGYVCCSKSLLILSKSQGRAGVLSLYCHRTNGPGACPVCRERRNQRIMKEVRHRLDVDGDLFWRVVMIEEVRRILDSLRGTLWGWYLRLPQPDEQSAIIANDNTRLCGEHLPDDELVLETLLIHLAECTPEGSRLSMTRRRKVERKKQSDWETFKIDATAQSVANHLEAAGASPNNERDDVRWYDAEPEVQEAVITALDLSPETDDPMPTSGRTVNFGANRV